MNLTNVIFSKALLPGPRSRQFGFDLFKQSKDDYLGHVDRLKAEFGDIVISQVVHEKVVDIHHPELIRQLLVDNADALIRWERGIDVFSKLHGQSVLIAEGETWKRQRRMLQPGFSSKRMADYSMLMCRASEVAFKDLPSTAVIQLDFLHWAHQLTMDVILQTLFGGSRTSMLTPTLRDHAIGAVSTMSKIGMQEIFWPCSAPDWMPHKAAKRHAKKVLDGIINSHIQLRRVQMQNGDVAANDVLGMLLSVRDESGDRSALSDSEIHDQCMTIFLAGHDTTATALTWWAWLIATHPLIAQRAAAQVDEVLQGKAPSYDDVARLPYLNSTLKEALRLYPPASALMSRRTLRDVQLGDWTIPKGAMVRVTPWAVHRDARWFAQPLRFDPDRFDAEQAPMHRHSFMPFGTGPRACIGSQFAMTEMTLIAAGVLQHFSLHAHTMPVPKFDLLLSPACTAPLELRRRRILAQRRA